MRLIDNGAGRAKTSITRIIDIAKLNKSIKPLLEAAKAMDNPAMPYTQAAMARGASFVQATWRSFAMGAPIPGSSRRLRYPEYAKSIEKREEGAYRQIVYTDHPDGEKIVEGTKARDLKTEVARWPKRRETKPKKKSSEVWAYAYIPFRHDAMKSYRLVPALKEIEKSVVTGQREDERGVARNTYRWGGRLGAGKDVPRRLAGAVRFETSTGGAKSSVVMTFRTLSAKSPAGSWIIPEKPGVPIVDAVENAARDTVVKLVFAGVKRDLDMKLEPIK